MARAGYCSGCGNYVFLRPDGGCTNGHGPEYVSNPYDVPDAGAAVPPPYTTPPQVAYPPQAAYQPPSYAPPAGPPAYAPATYASPAEPPRRKRTALVVTIAIVTLLLLCCCAAVGLAAFGVIPNPLQSAEHQKVAVAGDFFKALASTDAAGLVKTMPTQAASAAGPAFWIKALAEAESNSTLESSSWDGDVLTQTYKDADGTARTLVFTAKEGDKVEVTMAEGGEESGDAGSLTMVKEATGWKVLALGSGDTELIRFDAATVKKLQEGSEGAP